MMKKMTTVAALLLLALAPGSRAQQSWSGTFTADSLDADMTTALAIALNESPVVQIAGKEIVKKEYARKETRGNLLPNLSATGSYNRTLQKQTMSMNLGEQSSTIKVGSDNSWSGGFNLALPLVAPALWRTMQLTQLDINLAVEESRSSKITLIESVKNAYYTVLLTQDSYSVLQASYANAELNAKIANDKFQQGMVSEFDKLRADVQLRNQIPQLVAAENAMKLAKMQLKVLMGVDVDEPIRFTGELSDFERDMIQDLQYLAADTSLRANTSLAQLDIQTSQLRKALQITRSNYLPTLSMNGSYLWTSLNDDFKFGHYKWFPYSYVALTLNVPIYSGGMRRYQEAQSRISIEQMALQREELVRNLELSVQNSLNTIETSIEQLESNQVNIDEAKRAYDISQRRYDVGSGNLLELNDSELALTSARLSYNESIYNYLTARANLEATLGKTVEANVFPTSTRRRNK